MNDSNREKARPMRVMRNSRAMKNAKTVSLHGGWAAGLLGLLSFACAGGDGLDIHEIEVDSDYSESAPLTWEEFLSAATYTAPDGEKSFFIDGDVPVESEVALREIFERWANGESFKSIVRTNGENGTGGDVVWINDDELDITYCVSPNNWPTIAGQDLYQLTKTYMADATRAWQAVANVRYRYVSSQDAACVGGNTGVKINVVSGSASACASPPYTSLCQSGGRALAVNYGAIPQTYAERLPIFLHELGHTIGLEHEHWAGPTDTTPGCQASTAFRRLNGTATYDSNSIMAYACGGLTPGTVISVQDGLGARDLYGAPAAWHPAYSGMFSL